MSAEPGQKAPYSHVIRWRIVWQRVGMQLSFHTIATNLSISVDTMYNICKVFEVTGEVDFTAPSREETRSLNGHEELVVIGLHAL